MIEIFMKNEWFVVVNVNVCGVGIGCDNRKE